MKKLIFLLLLLGVVVPVNAANYEIKELIPNEIETTIVTDNFSYKNLYYNINNEQIEFKGIKNLTDKNLPVSISIGLFDDEQKNIGIVNYCSNEIASNEEKPFTIKITPYLAKDKTPKDIKYIAIISDNINCRTQGELDYVGKKIEDIGVIKKSIVDNNVKFVINIFTVIASIFFIIFLYRFLFTNAYRNFNGEDIRKEYDNLNKNLAKEREIKKKNEPAPKPKERVDKTDLIIEQEIKEGAKENKEKTDLHNLYK